MAFPSPSIPAPALTPYEFSYRGVKFGGVTPGAAYQLAENGITGGIDLPAMQNADTQRSVDDGEFAGFDASNGRDIPIDLIVTTDSSSLDHARQELGACFKATGFTEYPLFVQLPSGVFACMARPRKFAFAVDKNTVISAGTPVVAALHSTDSRWYAAPSKQATVGLTSGTEGGLTVPANVPWVLATGSTVGTLDAWNIGYVEMRPVITFTGPCTNPAVANISITGSPKLAFDVILNTGDTLTVDLDTQAILLQTAGSVSPVYRPDLLAQTGVTWWELQPANGPDGIGSANRLLFSTTDGAPVAGTMTVQYADAYPVL